MYLCDIYPCWLLAYFILVTKGDRIPFRFGFLDVFPVYRIHNTFVFTFVCFGCVYV